MSDLLVERLFAGWLPPMRVSPSAAITCLAIFLLATTNAFGGERVRRIEVIISDLRPLPFELKGYLRRPEGLAQYPAVILVPACNQLYPSVEQFWGDLITSWGYVTLTLDSFGSRGMKDDCLQPAPLELAQDAYRALSFLGKKSFVDAKSVILVGFGQGGTLILSAIATDGIAPDAKRTFVAAAAFYPYCGAFNGKFAVQTWIVVGELDTWTTADSCRRLAEGRDDTGINRTKGSGRTIDLAVVPNGHHFFDVKGIQHLVRAPHHLEYSEEATQEAARQLSKFIRVALTRAKLVE